MGTGPKLFQLANTHSFLLQLISSQQLYINFLLVLSDFAVTNKFVSLRDTIRSLLKLLPTGQSVTEKKVNRF